MPTSERIACQETAFACHRGGFAIRGTCVLPAERGRFPAAVLCHGFLSNQQAMMPYARFLASMGYAAYCFDFVGGATESQSDGVLTDMTPLTEVDDLRAVLAFVHTQDCVNHTPVLLWGASQGGFVSALAAARVPEQIGTLVLFYPALCIPDDARRGQMISFCFDPQHIPETITDGVHVMSRRLPESVKDMDIFAEIGRYRGRVLLVHGDADALVPLRYSLQALRTYQVGGNVCSLEVIPGGGHGFDAAADAVALKAVRAFLMQ